MNTCVQVRKKLGQGDYCSGWCSRVLNIVFLVLLFFCSVNLNAQQYIWDGDTSSNWNNSNNWVGNIVPPTGNVSGQSVLFNTNATFNSINLNQDFWATASTGITFDTNAGAYTFSGTGLFVIGGNAGVYITSAVTNSQTLNVRLQLGGARNAGTYNLVNNSTAVGQALILNTNIVGGGGSGTAGVKTLAVSGSGLIVINGTISRGGGTSLVLTKSGSGTLALTADNGVNFNGGTTLSGGTLLISQGGSIGVGTITVTGNSTLGARNSTNILSGTNILVTNNIAVNSGALLSLSSLNSFNFTNSGIISGLGSLRTLNSGSVILTGVNTFTGNVTINSTTILKVLDGGQLGSGNYAGNITNNGSFTYGGIDPQILSGVISGNGALTTVGNSTLTLLGINTYRGGTSVQNNSSINLRSLGQLTGTTEINLSSGTFLLGGNNQVNTSANLNLNNGTLSMRGNEVTRASSQTFNTLTLTADSVIDFSALSGTSTLTFSNIVGLNNYTLSIWNWNGTTLWGETSTTGGEGQYTRLYDILGSGLSSNELSNISFYSGSGSGFLGSGAYSLDGEIIPIAEPSVRYMAGIAIICLLCSLSFVKEAREN